jgi:hypothetical protein
MKNFIFSLISQNFSIIPVASFLWPVQREKVCILDIVLGIWRQKVFIYNWFVADLNIFFLIWIWNHNFLNFAFGSSQNFQKRLGIIIACICILEPKGQKKMLEQKSSLLSLSNNLSAILHNDFYYITISRSESKFFPDSNPAKTFGFFQIQNHNNSKMLFSINFIWDPIYIWNSLSHLNTGE